MQIWFTVHLMLHEFVLVPKKTALWLQLAASKTLFGPESTLMKARNVSTCTVADQ